MTPQQNACLIAIRELTVDGVSPSLEELQLHMGLSSKSLVHRLITALVEEGVVRRTPGRARNIEVVERFGAAISDARIASMSIEALESAATRIGAALAHRTALSQAMREGAGA